jgi:hypothetical protein
LTASTTLADALAQLAKVPPKAFVRARDALARLLREANHADVAAQVKTRRVPALPLWIVNRLAIEAPEEVETLIAAAGRVKSAQLGQKSGGAGDLAAATVAHRTAIDHLLARGAEMVREAGAVSSHQLQDRIQTTLTTAAADPSTRATLRTGQLDHELAARGFDVFEGAALRLVPKPSRPHPPEPEEASDSSRDSTIASPARRAKSEERQRQREAERAERQARVDAARAAVTEAESRLSSAREQVTSAQKQLAELRTQAARARATLRERTAEMRRATQAVEHAKQALRRAGKASAR